MEHVQKNLVVALGLLGMVTISGSVFSTLNFALENPSTYWISHHIWEGQNIFILAAVAGMWAVLYAVGEYSTCKKVKT